MKSLVIIIIVLFYYSLAYSAAPDSLNANQKKPAIEEEATKLSEKKAENYGRRKGKIDAFIDKDGDGICDQRVKGMSFEKAQRRHMQRNQGGKKGNGNQNGKQ